MSWITDISCQQRQKKEIEIEESNKRKSYQKMKKRYKIETWLAKQNVKQYTTERQVERIHAFKSKRVKTEEILLTQ